jgi:hypothetical protein
MRQDGKKKIMVLVLACLIGLAGLGAFYMLMLSPQKDMLLAKQNQVDQEEQKRQILRLASMPSIREKRIQQLESLNEKLLDMVGDYTDSSGMTFAVSEIARDKNLKYFTTSAVKSGADSDLEKCERLTEQRISVSFNADFMDFMKLINALERSRPVVFIDRLNVLREDENHSEVKADMELACYSRKKQSEENNSDSKK